jgi:GNAT superfamily N-acetyltransferase
MPEEELSLDELLAVGWDDPEPGSRDEGVVLGTADGRGAVSVVVRAFGDDGDGDGDGDRDGDGGGGGRGVVRLGFVKLIAVHPDVRRGGIGHALMDAAEQWAWAHDAIELHLSGAAPFYFWPGVDATALEMTCLAESRGYERSGSDINMAIPTAFRAEPPAGVDVRRVVSDADVAAVHAFVARVWPEWVAEMVRAVEHGCCHGAFSIGAGGDQAIGFACHSVCRAGWIGPMGTDPDVRAGGVGSALLGQLCRDLMIAEYAHAEICWVGPVRFYAKNGATVSRVFRQHKKRRPKPQPLAAT